MYILSFLKIIEWFHINFQTRNPSLLNTVWYSSINEKMIEFPLLYKIAAMFWIDNKLIQSDIYVVYRPIYIPPGVTRALLIFDNDIHLGRNKMTAVFCELLYFLGLSNAQRMTSKCEISWTIVVTSLRLCGFRSAR